MNWYLAARFSRQAELIEVAETLRAQGETVKCRWLAEVGTHDMEGQQDAHRAQLATEDMEDIIKSDCMLVFTEEETDKKRGRPSKGGMYVEMGMGIAWNKRVILIGPKTNVFCWLPHIEHYEDLETFLDSEL